MSRSNAETEDYVLNESGTLSDEDDALTEDQEFDKMMETYIKASKNFSLPEYLPIDRATKVQVDQLQNKSNVDLIRQLKTELIQSTDKFLLDQIGGEVETEKDPQDTINRALESLRKLADLETELRVLSNATQSVKGIVRNRFSNEEELSYKTIEHYKSLQNPPSNLSGLFLATLDEEMGKSDAIKESLLRDLIELQQHAFVVHHPQEPLPNHLAKPNRQRRRNGDNEDEDDDIEIEGGKIELVCPISREPFVNPIKSVVCGHTFSKSSIVHHLRNNRQCPISGCNAMLTLSQFQPDNLMSLRVKSYNAFKDKEEKQRRKNLEVVA